jgi:hypothetical protein
MVRVAIGNRDARIESSRSEDRSAVHFPSVSEPPSDCRNDRLAVHWVQVMSIVHGLPASGLAPRKNSPFVVSLRYISSSPQKNKETKRRL